MKTLLTVCDVAPLLPRDSDNILKSDNELPNARVTFLTVSDMRSL